MNKTKKQAKQTNIGQIRTNRNKEKLNKHTGIKAASTQIKTKAK